MNMYEIIQKKRDGGRLSAGEIDYFISGIVAGSIPDYQASALLMAIYFQKMDYEETLQLTKAMRDSGDIADLSEIPGIKVDKHSTGGVGDKTTMIIAPMAAAAGIPVAKMSGRALGFTGGTIDKLEAIPGFRTRLAMSEFKHLVVSHGIAVMGQTADVAKADKIIYALRDVTATVENMSLIASSIMSKKLASGSDAILLDVKCGSGAFMKNEEQAEELAEMLVRIGKDAGRRTAAVISDMEQPLGNAVGNALEVSEAIATLKGEGPKDITELSVYLAGMMIWLGGKADSGEEGIRIAEESIDSGAALDKFRQFVEGQGGEAGVITDASLMGTAEASLAVKAETDGYVTSLSAEKIGMASLYSGAGRTVKDSPVDLNAGVLLECKTGDKVSRGSTLATVFGEKTKLAAAAAEVKKAYRIGRDITAGRSIIRKTVGF
ncbi:MAG: thymidine phosphorylase [Eubacteriaceae bacterium]|jgi:pyrimidine-nucleoside phosphorylase|nr:thymidine phosphorylase [Eubacteriaceae bacterium]